jgi:hypothetical protein
MTRYQAGLMLLLLLSMAISLALINFHIEQLVQIR